MKVPFKDKQLKIEDAQRLIGYLGSSFDDYIAARVLFNNNLLIQACCLANTAIEKYFKAFVEFKGNTIKVAHDLEKLLPTVKNYDADLYDKLNKEFLLELTKIYQTRYLGDCPRGYNLVILRNKYLAELDFTYSLLEPKIRYSKKREGFTRPTTYELFKSQKNPAIWLNNYLFNEIDKTDFIESLDYVHELRILEINAELLEIKYTTKEAKNDGKFRIEGVIPRGDNKNFGLSHKAFVKE